MKPIAPITLIAMLFLTTAIASVAAAGGYGPGFPMVRIPETAPGAPTVVGTQVSGLLTLTFPDGTSVTVTETTVTLRLCGASGCTTVSATLTPTGPGTYSYAFTIPSGLTGPVTIILPAGSLTDTQGTGFPSVDTAIGTFTAGSASAPALAASSVKYSKQSQAVMHTTQPLEQASQPQINLLIPALLALLSIAGVALVALPNKAS
jgi:hypothetical protein